jgi:hypothetical protein
MRRLVSVAALATLFACGDDDAGGGEPSEPELRAELLQMMEDDQAEQTGEAPVDG